MWTTWVPLMRFCIVERHHSDRVLDSLGWHSSGLTMLSTMIDCINRLTWEGGKELEGGAWPYIISWEMRRQQVCHAPPQIGEMPRDRAYYLWYRPVTRKYVDRNSAKLHQLVMCSN